MIKSIHFNHYRKLKNIDIEFTPNINVISGTNGTCKSSILHIISNSFQAVKMASITNDNLKKCITTIKAICKQYNPKLETLTREDKKFSDPAHGYKGGYYTVEYLGDNKPLTFRKHNSVKSTNQYRFAVKPEYKPKSGDSLPCLPIIYLGLSRLVTYGEFSDDEPITTIKKKLPQKYITEIIEIYKKFTHQSISNVSNQTMGTVKNRADFDSSEEGIDSNTISAGEDNLYIILSTLVSLKYYYECLQHHNDVDSILLIDEFDASLHPAFQKMLFDLALDFSHNYHIQIVFTSHSLFLLEYCTKCKQNLIYLYNNETSVCSFNNPTIYQIQMYLKNQTKDEIFADNCIPIYTEDEQARSLIKTLFNYFSAKHEDFNRICGLFYLVEANIGSDILRNIFRDAKLKTFVGQFCILDGDQSKDLSNNIIALPGKNSPEKFLIEYAECLFRRDDKFWTSELVMEWNYGKPYYRDKFLPDVEEMEGKLKSLKEDGESSRGVRRSIEKKLFNKHQKMFSLLFNAWLSDGDNKSQIDAFYEDVFTMFKKTAALNGIDKDLWNTP